MRISDWSSDVCSSDLRRLSRDAYLQRLAEMNIAAQAVADVPDAVMLAEPRPVDKIPGFNGGQVSVQDASAQLAVALLDLQSGQRVPDACAASGGKRSDERRGGKAWAKTYRSRC